MSVVVFNHPWANIAPQLEEVEEVVHVHIAVAGEVPWARIEVDTLAWVVGRRVEVQRRLILTADEQTSAVVAAVGKHVVVDRRFVAATCGQAAEITALVVEDFLALSRCEGDHLCVVVARVLVETAFQQVTDAVHVFVNQFTGTVVECEVSLVVAGQWVHATTLVEAVHHTVHVGVEFREDHAFTVGEHV